jgi:hypothetical protein
MLIPAAALGEAVFFAPLAVEDAVWVAVVSVDGDITF